MTMMLPFDLAVRTHGATVLRVCRAVLGPGPDAEDAWQETFLAALRSWPELGEVSNLEAWLVRVAGRKAIDVLRARARHPVPVEELPETVVAPASDADGHAAVWTAVATLPERQRLAIAYHYLGGLRHTETAALIGSTPEAVRRAAADGLKTLRDRYDG
ncbi:MAG: sigma-70 family polymerase sigma factor [Citricoccus sp.]|nr:sigma-70 family polymerase sigma factor [Citricoccus sp. WCRC_4]